VKSKDAAQMAAEMGSAAAMKGMMARAAAEAAKS